MSRIMARRRNSINMDMSYFCKDSKFDKDERLSRRLKRRFGVHKSPKSVVKNSGVKASFDDYVDHDDDHDNDEVNDDDPEYLTFLKHLREDGSSYILEIALNDEKPLRIVYEKDDEFVVDYDVRPDNGKRLKDIPSRDSVKTDRVLRSSGKNKDSQNALRSVPNRKRKISSTVKDVKLEWGVKETATQKPRPLMREVKQEMGSAMEEEDIEYDVPSADNLKTKRILRISGKNKESPKALRSVQDKKRKISSTVKDVQPKGGVKVTATRKPRPLMREVKQEMGSAMEEEEDDYESFLKCLELDGDSLVMVTKDGKRTKYEEDDEQAATDSDSDIEVIEVAPQLGGTPSPFVTSKTYYHDFKGFSSPSNLKFREKLTDILRKPFDQEEYDELHREAFERKPIERCRELRSGTKRCAILEICGKSYLDHNPDLKNEIDSVRHNSYMVLKLLRGFFFWLKNVSQDGGFRPWLDKSCLEQIRQTTSNATLSM